MVKLNMLKTYWLKLVIFSLTVAILWLSQGFAQSQRTSRTVFKPDENTLCVAAKNRGKNYILEDGEIIYQNQVLATTVNSCFTLPKNFCKIGASYTLEFKPNALYARFKQKFNVYIRGVNKRYGNQTLVKCIPTGASAYPRDPYTLKIPDFVKLNRLLNVIPYVENVQIKNQNLLNQVKPYISDCKPNDITCYVYSSYQAVTKNLSYKSDPYAGGRDYIRSPQETIANKGGDCEDLTGVLVSFLANLKVDSYVVMTSDHAYAMACDVAPKVLQNYVDVSMERNESETRNLTLRRGGMQTFSYTVPGADPQYFKWQLGIKSEYPFNVFVVKGRVSQSQLRNRNFQYDPNCSVVNVTEANLNCTLTASDTIVMSHGVDFPNITASTEGGNNQNNIKLTISQNYNLAKINNVSIHYYRINRNNKLTYCVVLEPTAGANGYPGFSRVKNQPSIAISPVTWDWFYVSNPVTIH